MNTHEQLHTEYLAGDVCLFVGAGVSRGCGLPDWRGLAREVVWRFPHPGVRLGSGQYDKSKERFFQGKQPPPDPNALSTEYLYHEKADVLTHEEPLLAMRYARSDGTLDLCSLVSQCLYGRPITLSETVLEIPLLEKVKRICCFNYDDILDRAFAERDRTYMVLFQDGRIPLEAPQTIVFYPHGFLPDPNRQSFPATGAIVLSEDDYFDLYRSPYAWANMVQLTLLLNYTALFIGCSLLDPNVRRLLDIAAKMRPNHSHYAFFRDPYYRKEPKWYEEDYATAFRAVQESLLKGLGVQPIWVHEYEEIGPALRRLRA